MGYSTVETALIAVIRKVSGYDTANVFADDYRVLARGKSSKAVVVRRAPSQHTELTMGATPNIENLWVINAELFTASSPAHVDLASQILTESQKLVDEIRKWPNLDNTSGVINVDIEIQAEPEEGDFTGGNARSKWWRQIIEVLATEIVTVTLSE